MKLVPKCKCPSGPRQLVVDLVGAWECWDLDSDGELIACHDSGNDMWANLRCADCDESLEIDHD